MLARIFTMAVAMLLATTITGGLTAYAQEPEPAQFNIKPVSIDGSYFDLDMSPGETRQLAVEIGNSGGETGTVTTYAANVHSLVNGGMGLGVASEAPDPTTAWLDYAPRDFELAPNMSEVHTFTVNVPEGTAPGQYITSIVVQAGDAQQITSSAEGVSLGAITRRGMAIAITVPGEATPSMSIGAARHILSADHSVVSIAVENTGYTRLKPSGEFVLADSAGVELTRFPVTMGLVYAQTTTTVEVPFSTILNPGTYTVSLSLTDETHNISANVGPLAMVVEEPEVPVAPDNGPGVANVDQQTSEGGSGALQADDQGIASRVLIAAIAGSLILGVAIAVAGSTLLRRRKAQATTQPIQTGAGDGWD